MLATAAALNLDGAAASLQRAQAACSPSGVSIARDTMHPQQRLAVIEELGAEAGNLSISNSFPQDKEDTDNNYNFYATAVDGTVSEGR